MNSRLFIVNCLFVLLLSINGCGVYSFSGASIPDGAETFWIELIRNEARLISPTLNLTLTEKLQDKFANETGLDLKERNPNLTFSGRITRYETRPLANAGTDVALLNELRIALEIKFLNNETAETWTQTFQQTGTFDQATTFTDVEDQLNEEISEILVQEVFNKAFVNW